ncbi:MAG: hypothetical protein U0892_17390 [Pirellulales bacterium]
MAVRDRNLFAWQAYVIVMSFVSVLVLVGTFLLWRAYSDLQKKNAELAGQVSTAQKEVSSGVMRVQRLKAMIGYGNLTEAELANMATSTSADPELAEVEANFTKDMKLFDPNQAKKDYRQLPIFLLDTIRVRNKQIEDARELQKKQMADMDAVVMRETKAREDADAKAAKAVADLEATRRQHADQIAAIQKEKEANEALFTKFKADHEAKSRVLEGKVAQLTSENAKQKETIAAQAAKIVLLEDQEFDAPAGEVINVAQGGRIVWVNIGSDDGLREGVPFTVLEQSTLKVAEAKPKAEMVVEEVTSGHMARCRVLSENYRNPVLPGDLVYSPAWRKGRKLGFALVGKMDVNGDGSDDREMIHDILKNAGAVIDAEILPDGTRKNTPGMTPNTYSVVLGSDVGINNENANAEQAQRNTNYGKFMSEAKSYGIQQISMERLLSFLRTKNDARTVPLGSQRSAADFPSQPIDGVVPSVNNDISEIFKRRKPAN